MKYLVTGGAGNLARQIVERLLGSGHEVLALDLPDTAPVADLRPTRVCIITCDRPGTVERLLDSMLRSGNLSRHDELLMIDDSRDPANGDYSLLPGSPAIDAGDPRTTDPDGTRTDIGARF